ncbi:hypothetical protein HN587_05480 [Candidatus Woesearchaeota archaeon]|jgi:hypothetical protein|nr:hypothetical protein [Candidatus Woesearchaeota archaeon]
MADSLIGNIFEFIIGFFLIPLLLFGIKFIIVVVFGVSSGLSGAEFSKTDIGGYFVIVAYILRIITLLILFKLKKVMAAGLLINTILTIILDYIVGTPDIFNMS